MITAGITWFFILCFFSALTLIVAFLIAGTAVVYDIFHGMWKTWKQK